MYVLEYVTSKVRLEYSTTVIEKEKKKKEKKRKKEGESAS